MKKNAHQKPTIDSITLGPFSFGALQKEPRATEFHGTFFYGNEKEEYIGEFSAGPEHFIISPQSAKILLELVSSLEEDMAKTLFDEVEDVELEQEEKLPADIRQTLEYPADPTFDM